MTDAPTCAAGGVIRLTSGAHIVFLICRTEGEQRTARDQARTQQVRGICAAAIQAPVAEGRAIRDDALTVECTMPLRGR